MNNIMVSICCITYNHKDYIGDAINGFLNQSTNFPFEVIIHDDASIDGTQAMVKEFSQRMANFHTIFQTQNQWAIGVKASPTFVWPKATGKYIALCEGDDYWIDDKKLQKQIDYLENHPECNAVCCLSKVKSGDVFLNDELTKNTIVEFKNILLGRKANTRTPTIVFRNDKTLLGRFNDFGNFNGNDRKLKMLLTMNGSYIKVLPFYGAIYRHHAGGVWSMVARNKKRSAIQNDYLETHKHFPMPLGLKLKYVLHHFRKTLLGDVRYGRFNYLWQTLMAIFIKPKID